MPTLDRDSIRRSLDLPTRRLTLERWGGEVVVRAMPIASAAYTGFKNQPDKKGRPPSPEEYAQRRILGAAILSTLDDEGNQLFNWGDAEWLREKHWLTILDIATAAFELAGDDTPLEDRVARLVNDYGIDEVHAALEAVTGRLNADQDADEDAAAAPETDDTAAPEDGPADPLAPTSGS